MADDPDLTGLEENIARHAGIENHPHGFLLVRVARLLRRVIVAVRGLDDRLTAVEQRLPPPP